MGWNCKPSGGYAITSQEGSENINAFYNYLSGVTNVDNVVGMLCNVCEESGLNPWRWQGDTVSLSAGYGLFQFTPASGYINLTGIPGHAPNMSTSTISGGSTTDAEAQLYVLANDVLSKWVGTCWRSYWSQGDYPTLYTKHTYILNTYGNGSILTMSQFFNITNTEDACFAFLACYEGPLVPNLQQRLSHEQDIRDVLQPTPPPPPPTGSINYGAGREVIRRLILHA